MSSRDEGIIDVERRKENAEYALGDPTLFPPEFLNWLKRFIEQSGISLPASAIYGLSSGGVLKNLPAGSIFPYAGGTAPDGTLPANGQSVGRDAYPKLWLAIGVTYGSVDSSSFSLPDYRGRALYGLGGPHTALMTSNDGIVVTQRSPRHRHDVYVQSGGIGLQGGATAYNMFPTDDPVPQATTTPSGAPMVDTPAYHAVLYVITTG